MATVTFEYDQLHEAEDIKAHINTGKIISANWDFSGWLRDLEKHQGNPSYSAMAIREEMRIHFEDITEYIQ